MPVAAVTPTPMPVGKTLATATPSVTFDLPLSFPAFICKLPISTPGSAQAAFIAVGSMGTVTFIPQAAGVHYYNRAFSRWLPVGREAVAPDGLRYTFVESGDPGVYLVHVVDAANGKDHVFSELASVTGLQAPPVVLDYSAEGIYMVQAFEHLLAGLWLADPNTGSVRQLSSSLLPIARTPGFIWVQALNSADPNPVVTGSSAGTLPNEIDRVDLKSGNRVTWLYRPGTGLGIVGFDLAGHPLIESSRWGIDPNAELLIAPDPSTQRSIYRGAMAKSLGNGIADGHGVWLGSDQGIYLYSEADGLQKISNQPGRPANGCI